jgi:hypothetical protein
VKTGFDMRRRVRLLAIVTSVAIAGSLQAGVATGLVTTAAGLGAGTAAIPACDGDGFTFRYTINAAGRVSSVNVSGIDGSCAGGTLKVTLVNGVAAVGSGSVSLPSSGFTGAADVAISPQPLSDGVTAVHASLEGP